MEALEVLSNEHGLIRRFLENLSLAVEKLQKNERPPAAFFEIAMEFARTFADRYHHFKEEHVMFTLLAQKKDGAIDPQLEVLRYEHERGRAMIANIGNALGGYARGEMIATAAIVENVSSYIGLLRHHIHREDHIFYPMAQRTMSEEEGRALMAEFERSRQKCGERTFENCHKMVVDMGTILVHM